jgi:hypothetical protein
MSVQDLHPFGIGDFEKNDGDGQIGPEIIRAWRED